MMLGFTGEMAWAVEPDGPEASGPREQCCSSPTADCFGHCVKTVKFNDFL